LGPPGLHGKLFFFGRGGEQRGAGTPAFSGFCLDFFGDERGPPRGGSKRLFYGGPRGIYFHIDPTGAGGGPNFLGGPWAGGGGEELTGPQVFKGQLPVASGSGFFCPEFFVFQWGALSFRGAALFRNGKKTVLAPFEGGGQGGGGIRHFSGLKFNSKNGNPQGAEFFSKKKKNRGKKTPFFSSLFQGVWFQFFFLIFSNLWTEIPDFLGRNFSGGPWVGEGGLQKKNLWGQNFFFKNLGKGLVWPTTPGNSGQTRGQGGGGGGGSRAKKFFFSAGNGGGAGRRLGAWAFRNNFGLLQIFFWGGGRGGGVS